MENQELSTHQFYAPQAKAHFWKMQKNKTYYLMIACRCYLGEQNKMFNSYHKSGLMDKSRGQMITGKKKTVEYLRKCGLLESLLEISIGIASYELTLGFPFNGVRSFLSTINTTLIVFKIGKHSAVQTSELKEVP